jgi:hypothetical protein
MKDMNRRIGAISSIVNVCAVAVFAICMLFGLLFGAYLSSIFIAFSFVTMVCAFASNGTPKVKVAGSSATIFAGIYTAINSMVYFAQITTVRFASLNDQATSLLDFQKYGLLFNYDMLGYCFMSLATFFIGLTIKVTTKADRVLKWLLLIHGVFATCLFVPLTGLFAVESPGAEWIGMAVLGLWSVYFIPIGVLSFIHFRKMTND